MYEPLDGAAGVLSEQMMTVNLLSEQMAVVGALLDRVMITEVGIIEQLWCMHCLTEQWLQIPCLTELGGP